MVEVDLLVNVSIDDVNLKATRGDEKNHCFLETAFFFFFFVTEVNRNKTA